MIMKIELIDISGLPYEISVETSEAEKCVSISLDDQNEPIWLNKDALEELIVTLNFIKERL